jgi:hypothetical protein
VTILESSEKTKDRCEICGYNRFFLNGVVIEECKCITLEGTTEDEMKNAEVGTLVEIACLNCEGHEKHQKQENGKWKCLWCKHSELK